MTLDLADLVARGLVSREVLPGDRRRARLALTESGRRLFESAFPPLVDLSRAMLSALSPQEVEALDADPARCCNAR